MRQAPLRSCNAGNVGALRVNIPPPGTEDGDTNPARIAPRHLFDVGAGLDRIRLGRTTLSMRVTVVNLFDRVALYNFLSTFSGTHFVTPRSVRLDVTTRF